MRRTWSRLLAANDMLMAKKEHPDEVEAARTEYTNAVDAYRNAARRAGYIGANGRTSPPHIKEEPGPTPAATRIVPKHTYYGPSFRCPECLEEFQVLSDGKPLWDERTGDKGGEILAACPNCLQPLYVEWAPWFSIRAAHQRALKPEALKFIQERLTAKN